MPATQPNKIPKDKKTKLSRIDKNKKMKKNKDSDSENEPDNDNNSSNSENEELIESNNVDMMEYRKMLAKMFPSKYMNERVKKLEEKEKAMLECKKEQEKEKDKKQEKQEKQEKQIITDDEDDNKPMVEVKNNKKQNNANKKVCKQVKKNSKKKITEVSEEEEEPPKSSSSESSSEESDGETTDSSEEGFKEFAKEHLKKGNFNIVISLHNDSDEDNDSNEDSEDDSEEWETESEEEGEEYDSEDEDDPEYIPEEEESSEEEKNEHNKRKTRSNKKDKKEDDNIDEDNEEESEETIKKIKTQMEELLKINKNDRVAKEMLENITKKEKILIDRREKAKKKEQKKNVKMFSKMLRQKNSSNDLKYFKKNLTSEQQQKVLAELIELNKLTLTDKPYRLTLLESEIPKNYKAIALKKINNLRHMEPGAGEYYKIKNWVDTFMQIPFGKVNNLPLTMNDGIEKCHEFMESSKNTLDAAAYGLNDAKMQIMQMIGQWLSNPSAMGTAIAIKGPMGTGKTTIVREGISKILNREFAFIALGGATDSSFLEGHSYTYEGSTWGKIVEILIRAKSMNPVIYFDELDKISDTPKGEEITGILTHLTDTSQNSQFHDKYFAEIDFDLSKCLFIFSYNDESRVNPILLDRMYKITTSGYNKKDKILISNNYLIPKIRMQINFKEGDIVIPDETIDYIIENYTEKEDGVRNLKRCLEIIYKKLNLYRLVKPGTTMFGTDKPLVVEFPFHVTSEVVKNLIKKDEGIPKNSHNMYI